MTFARTVHCVHKALVFLNLLLQHATRLETSTMSTSLFSARMIGFGHMQILIEKTLLLKPLMVQLLTKKRAARFLALGEWCQAHEPLRDGYRLGVNYPKCVQAACRFYRDRNMRPRTSARNAHVPATRPTRQLGSGTCVCLLEEHSAWWSKGGGGANENRTVFVRSSACTRTTTSRMMSFQHVSQWIHFGRPSKRKALTECDVEWAGTARTNGR